MFQMQIPRIKHSNDKKPESEGRQNVKQRNQKTKVAGGSALRKLSVNPRVRVN